MTETLSFEPDLANAWLGRANAFVDLGRYDDALAAYDKALLIQHDLENAWLGRGNVLWVSQTARTSGDFL